MSLDVTLEYMGGSYEANITHNLAAMAREAGIYAHLWRPDECGITKAAELIAPLTNGLLDLVMEPERFKRHDAPNGWGRWEHFVRFVAEYREACIQHPEASVSVSR